MALIEVKSLDVGYPIPGDGLFSRQKFLPIVHDVTFDLDAGRTLGIVGESGCGKSTLGRAILRLIKPSSGTVLWEGKDLAALTSDTLRRKRSEIQIIFQDPLAALDPRMTVLSSVIRPLATFTPELPRSERERQGRVALEMVGLDANFAGRYPHELSGGQAQRVGIARALVGGPKLVVCDEPVSALDVSVQAQVVNLLMDLQEQLGLALVFISHNLAVVKQIAHEIVVLCLGRIVEKAPRRVFFESPLHPYSKAMMDAISEPDPVRERARRGTAITGELPSVLRPPIGCVFASRCPKAKARCTAERPELRMFPNNRQAACHFVEGHL